MREISMLEFRQQAQAVIAKLRRGQRMILTYRGKPVARLEPITDSVADDNDPFYQLDSLADRGGKSLSNPQIDKILYG